MNTQMFYNDYLYKKLKSKSDVLENRLEQIEHELAKTNEIGSLYNVSIPTQDDVWVCGRVFSENAGGGGGKLNEHNVSIQGSYVCSNSQSIQLNLGNCNEYSLFPGQIIMAKGRNPDGRKFVCHEIIEPNFAPITRPVKKEPIVADQTQFNGRSADPASITVPLEPNEELNVAVVSGPFMQSGSIATTALSRLIDQVKAKKVHVLFILGPLIDLNHDQISTGYIQLSYDELLQNIFDDIAAQFRNTKTQVIIQPSLNDITQDPIYPVAPFNIPNGFLKQNENIHLVPEPSLIKINDVQFAITTTDVIKDLTSISVSKSHSSDKISRNFTHLLKQRSFYPIYPPPDHVCVDHEAWQKYAQIDVMPKVFIAVSDLATFNKEVNNCACVNPGRLVRGSATGGFAQLTFPAANQSEQQNSSETKRDVNVTFHKI